MPSTIPRSALRYRPWIPFMVAALLLGGCHARSRSCHTSSCGSEAADGIVAAFYVFYILGWLIVAAAEG